MSRSSRGPQHVQLKIYKVLIITKYRPEYDYIYIIFMTRNLTNYTNFKVNSLKFTPGDCEWTRNE